MNRIFLFLLLAVLVSCTEKGSVKLTGHIENGKDKVLYLDQMSLNGLQTLDSVKLKAKGNFSFKLPKSEYPTFYFLKNEQGNGLSLLVDTLSHIGVNAKYGQLEATAQITGSKSSQRMQNLSLAIKAERGAFQDFLKEIDEEADPQLKMKLNQAYAEHIRQFKDSIGMEIIQAPINMVSYFILFQRLNEQYLLFDEYNKADYKYFAAVATSLNMAYPDDPRVKAFYQKTLNALKAQRAEKLQQRIAEAENSIPEIKLPNLQGDSIALSSIQNKVVLLNFWASQDGQSRAWNRSLKKMYSKYRSRGLDIYQVSIDQSRVLWEKAMEDDGIVWKSVCDYSGGKSAAALSYNVQKLPTTYLINKQGELVSRIHSEEQLEKLIRENL